MHVQTRDRRRLDLARLLEATRPLHKHVVHICLDSGETCARITIPVYLGKDLVIRMIRGFHKAAMYALVPARDSIADDRVQRFADTQDVVRASAGPASSWVYSSVAPFSWRTVMPVSRNE